MKKVPGEEGTEHRKEEKFLLSWESSQWQGKTNLVIKKKVPGIENKVPSSGDKVPCHEEKSSL